MKLTPYGNRILVEKPESEKATTHGIIISADSDQVIEAKVLGVGHPHISGGKEYPIKIKAGETVLFMRNSADKVKVADVEYLIVPEGAILAKIV